MELRGVAPTPQVTPRKKRSHTHLPVVAWHFPLPPQVDASQALEHHGRLLPGENQPGEHWHESGAEVLPPEHSLVLSTCGSQFKNNYFAKM